MNKKHAGKTVLVVDGGGRGAALVAKYAQSHHVTKIIAVPGNDLMQLTTSKSVKTFPHVNTTNVPAILTICRTESVDLVDAAQDAAVEAGLVDALMAEGIPTVGPTRAAGQIEWDKAWAREFGTRHGLPQPTYKICASPEEGVAYLKSQPDQPWFVKAAFLAEGKGALPAKNNLEAVQRIRKLSKFKEAGKVFLIEKWLCSDDGTSAEEFSTFVFCDGKQYQMIGSAQDHKRALTFDEGENTGGMGCSTPPLILTPKLVKEIQTTILDPTMEGLAAEGRPYTGVLYLGGIVVNQKGKPKLYVIEFNARWGDPEVQAVLPGLENDLFEVSMAIAQGTIQNVKLVTDGKSRVVITGAAKGYPTDYTAVKGKQVYGLDEARRMAGVTLYGAAVEKIRGSYYARGGRLFYLVGEGHTVIEARQKAYASMALISIEGNNLHYRTDIGWRDVARLREH